MSAPESAVIETGKRALVLLDKGDGPLRAARGDARPARRGFRRDAERRRRGRIAW